MEESKNCRSWEEETYWKHFHSVAFYQILPCDFHHRLKLPDKFTENMSGNLPGKVSLRGPNEVTWNVNLVKSNERVMFQGDGWREFVKAYTLKKSDILVFKYNRKECFEVVFFDGTSLCEKESSYFVRNHDQKSDCGGGDRTRKAVENSSDQELTDGSEEKDDNDCTAYASRKKIRRKMSRTPKKFSSAAYTRDDCHRNQRDESQTSDEENCSLDQSLEVIGVTPKYAACAGPKECRSNSSRGRKPKRTSISKHDIWYKSNRRPVTEIEKAEVLAMAQGRAKEYQNPFIVIMRPSSVYKRFFMTIPNAWNPKSSFRKGQTLILRVEEKMWVCKFTATCNNGGLGAGWREFTRDNFLEEFDVCLFVPDGIKDGMRVLDVTIFRVVQEVVPPSIVTPS